MTFKSGLDDLVAAGLRALKEERKIPPGERFDRLVRAGTIDECGRLLHQEGDPDDEISIRELRDSLAKERS
jgi:hypothetical protein